MTASDRAALGSGRTGRTRPVRKAAPWTAANSASSRVGRSGCQHVYCFRRVLRLCIGSDSLS